MVQQSSFRYGGSEQLLTSRVWEYGTRLQSIANTAWGLSVGAHAYQYGWVNRRWRASLADGSRWDYGYDDRNEVTSGKRYWSDGSAVAGQHFEYATTASATAPGHGRVGTSMAPTCVKPITRPSN